MALGYAHVAPSSLTPEVEVPPPRAEPSPGHPYRSQIRSTDPVFPVRADATGTVGPTRGEARGPRWRRSSRGLFVPADIDPTDPDQRIVEASAALSDGAAVTGWAGLRWAGGIWFGGTDAVGNLRPVPITCPGHMRSQPGMAVTEERLNPIDVVEIDSIQCTRPVRSLFNAMRSAGSLWQAAAVAEMAFFNDLVSRDELIEYVATHARYIGITQVRAVLPLLNENSWSPQETWLALTLIRAGWEQPPMRNVPIFSRCGTHLATVDLFEPRSGVVGEYEGAVHLDAGQRGRDLQREALLREHGLEYVAVVAADRRTPETVVHRFLAAQARNAAQAIPIEQRDWTLQRPHWWVSTDTVEARRLLIGTRQARLLAHRWTLDL